MSASATEIKERLRGFLAPHFMNYELSDTENIFDTGFVNSLFAMQLITYIERDFNITLDNDDLETENFETIEKITHIIQSKQ